MCVCMCVCVCVCVCVRACVRARVWCWILLYKICCSTAFQVYPSGEGGEANTSHPSPGPSSGSVPEGKCVQPTIFCVCVQVFVSIIAKSISPRDTTNRLNQPARHRCPAKWRDHNVTKPHRPRSWLNIGDPHPASVTKNTLISWHSSFKRRGHAS